MTYYAWTIKAAGRTAIRRVTALPELIAVLDASDLPGVAPAEWVRMVARSDAIAGHGRFVHNEGGRDAWCVSWTRLDDGMSNPSR